MRYKKFSLFKLIFLLIQVYCAFDSLRATCANLQRRWDALCATSQDRLEEAEGLHRDWTAFNERYAEVHTWVKERRVQVSATDVEASKVPHEELRGLEEELEHLRAELTGMDAQDQQQPSASSRVGQLDAFNDAYCELAREYRLDASDDLKGKFIAVNRDWEQLAREAEALLLRVRRSRQAIEGFASLRDREMAWLRGMDARLTEV